ncbi:DUF188 domain-containing protein [Candidatus Woesearchaeota archaeon]|nr:DUF188 domain-containing protein [Candidatus Woesearchaeota archaeon]
MLTKKTKVILDTNTLLLPGKGIDIFSLLHDVMQEPYKLCTYQGVLEELQTLMIGQKKDAFNAKLGYILAKQKPLKILTSSSATHVDDDIVKKTGKNDVVVTQDRTLTRRLREKGVRVLRYQQKRFIFR